MLRERTLPSWPLLLGLLTLGAVTVGLSLREPASAPPSPPPEHVWASDLRAAEAAPPDTDSQLLTEQRIALAIAFDADSPPIAAFEALRRARTLDVVLGTGLDEGLSYQMRWLAPRAAEAYGALGDREGRELALHTAALVGAP